MFEPRKADSDGLIECLSSALHSMGIEDILDMQDVLRAKGKHHPILVGMGTDGRQLMFQSRMACEERFKRLYLGYLGLEL